MKSSLKIAGAIVVLLAAIMACLPFEVIHGIEARVWHWRYGNSIRIGQFEVLAQKEWHGVRLDNRDVQLINLKTPAIHAIGNDVLEVGGGFAPNTGFPSPGAGRSSVPVPSQSSAAGYTKLVFSDNFDTLSLSNRGTGSGHRWYNPGIWWESGPAPSTSITNAGGVLNLTWNPGQTPAYDTSIATSSTNGATYAAWQHGYIEVRMKFPAVTGEWPALWLLPSAEITCPIKCENGEIDIFEWQSTNPGTFYGHIHDWLNKKDLQNNNSNAAWPIPAGTDLTQYHTYGLLWTPTTISWYFDNGLMGSYPTFAILNSQSYYLVLTNQVGTNWSTPGTGGSVTASAATTMNVQWVHVFH